MNVLFILFVATTILTPQCMFSTIFLASDNGRNVELSSTIQLHFTRKFAPEKFIHLENIEPKIVEKFLQYIEIYTSLTKKPFYSADVVDELAKISITVNDDEFWKLFEMAHIFDAPAIAYALSSNYFKQNRATIGRDQLLNPEFALQEPAQETLRKHYFILTGDASVMNYKNSAGKEITLMFTLQEITHVKRLEIENAKFNLSGLFLCSLEGLQIPSTSVDNLDLSNNFLTELPQNFCVESTLKKLNLAHNKIKKLPDSLEKLTHIEFLDVSNNQLTTLPEGLGKLTNLCRLDAEKNNITQIPESLCNCSQLRWLNLGDNKLKELPEHFIHLTSIDKLYLQNNDFTSLPKQLYLLPHLRILSIKNNAFDQLPPDARLALKCTML